MSISRTTYNLIARSFKYEFVKRLKRKVRPIKHFLFGREGIYEAISAAKDLSRQAGKEIRTAFDIGAADGDYALNFLEAFPRASVYCFEPQTASFEKLEKKLSKFKHRAPIFKTGFWNTNTNAEMSILSHADSSSVLPIDHRQSGFLYRGKEVVALRRLDDFVRENKIKHIDFLKIDVEGAEKEVLEGGMDTLTDKVDHLYIEISFSRKGRFSSNYIDVLRLIHEAGFALLFISETENFFFSKLVQE